MFAFDTSMYDRVGAESLRAALASRTLLAQGPTGSALITEAGVADIPAALWNIAEPQVVSRIHLMHAAAGADVMITNTFQASAPALARDGVHQGVGEVNRAAVDCARAAHAEHVLGSIGSCGLSWVDPEPEAEPEACEGVEAAADPEVAVGVDAAAGPEAPLDDGGYRKCRAAYADQAAALLSAGVAGLLLETFISIHDLEPALDGARCVADGMPLLVSFSIDDECNLLGDHLPIEEAVAWAQAHGATAVGVNCCSLAAADAALGRMKSATSLPVMVRPHAGLPELVDGMPVWTEDPEAFARSCQGWVEAGAALVGSCCGATPRTTCALDEVLELLDRS